MVDVSACGDIKSFKEFREGNEERFNEFLVCVGRLVKPDKYAQERELHEKKIQSLLNSQSENVGGIFKIATYYSTGKKLGRKLFGKVKVEKTKTKLPPLITTVERVVFR